MLPVAVIMVFRSSCEAAHEAVAGYDLLPHLSGPSSVSDFFSVDDWQKPKDLF